LTIGSALASVGSAALNGAAQGQVNAARGAAQRAENERQDRWEEQIRKLREQSLGRFANVPSDMAGRAQTVADFYKASGGSLPSSGVTAGVIPQTNGLVAREGTNQMNKVAAFNDQQGKALGNLRSFGDVMAGANRGVAIDNGLISGIDSMRRGSSTVLPLELQNANNAGNGLKTFADILGGLGKVGMSAGLAGGWDKLFGVGNTGPTGKTFADELVGGTRAV
jgi:hypothetical protein